MQGGRGFLFSWLRSRHRGTNPSARLRRAPPLSGEALQEVCLTEDIHLYRGMNCRSGEVYLPPSAVADDPPPSAEGGKEG